MKLILFRATTATELTPQIDHGSFLCEIKGVRKVQTEDVCQPPEECKHLLCPQVLRNESPYMPSKKLTYNTKHISFLKSVLI